MIRTAFLSIALAAIALAQPAMAQSEFEIEGEQQVGTRFLQEPETVEAGRARMMQREVARCVYSRDRKDVTEILANSDFHQIDFEALDTDPENVFEDLQISRCIGQAMRAREFKMYMQFPLTTMRNLLAEAAYLDEYRDGITLADGAPEVLENRKFAPRRYPPTKVTADLADCLVYNNAKATHDLLRSRPTSGDEKDAFEALKPTLGKCMKTDQAEVTLGLSMLRMIVADGLWSRIHYGEVDDA